MNRYEYEDYLMHYGVKGMKWGVRRAVRGHGGPGIYVSGNKKKLSGYKKDLKVLNDGGHLSVGGTKKRQAAYDKRDRANLEKKIAKTESKIAEKENMTPEQQKAARRKTALKVGAVVAGTALAAYGAAKAHEFIREKNQDIRLNEGKAKCDSMLKKLDRMRIKDLTAESTANAAWVNTGKKTTPFQYNNNGKTVTIPKQYRNTQSTLKNTQYRNIENKVIDKTISEAFDKARNDSFATAAKNVSKHYLEEAKRYVRNR